MVRISEFKSVLQVLDYFKDEETCKKHLEQSRWGGTVNCPHCGNAKVYRTNRGFRCAEKTCAKKFSVTVGTVMQDSKIKLRYWFAATYLITAHKKGISSHQLARDLGVTQKTAWFMLHRIRETLKEQRQPLLKNIVEVDETLIGGIHANRHAKKKEQIRLAGFKDKTIVVGFLERDGRVVTEIVNDVTSDSLVPLVYEKIKKGSIVMTDEHRGYAPIKADYFRQHVAHSKGEYARGITHTNGIENYWSLLKRSIVGIYHHVTPKHLGRYCEEMNYRFNTRTKTDCERFDYALTHVEGRLRWNDLVNA